MRMDEGIVEGGIKPRTSPTRCDEFCNVDVVKRTSWIWQPLDISIEGKRSTPYTGN